MKVVDVNILVYVVNAQDERHRQITSWWAHALRGDEAIALPWPVIAGFLRVATNPRVFEQPLTSQEAVDDVAAWLIHPTVCTISETDGHWDAFKELITIGRISGKHVSDAHLAAMAITRNATLVSCDTDFARFRQLRWENPAG